MTPSDNTEEHNVNRTALDESAASSTPADQNSPAPTPEGHSATDNNAADNNDTDAASQNPADRISELRTRIDEIDASLIELWLERAAISHEVGATRMANGGTRLVLAREQEILNRFRAALGVDGTQLAMLILRAGRGPLI